MRKFRHQTVGCNITYIIRFLEGLYPFWTFIVISLNGQLESRQGFVHYEQSSGNTARFPSLNDAEVLSQRHQTVGCNITYIIRFLEGLYPFWTFVLMNNPGI